MRVLLAAAAIAIALIVGTLPASAMCVEGLGCTDAEKFTPEQLEAQTCEVLWEVRNTMLFEQKFCFQERAAAERFGNKGCTIDNMDYLQFNGFEQSNFEAVSKAQTAKSC
jgi:hypothetical protein